MRWGGTLRFIAVVGVVGAALGVIIAPGLRGNALQHVVERADFAATSDGNLLALLLVAACTRGASELLRAPQAPFIARGLFVPATLLVTLLAMLALGGSGLGNRLPAVAWLLLSTATATLGVLSGAFALRAPHTRAAALIILSFSVAALCRVAAWRVAAAADEQLSIHLLRVSRYLATAAVGFESFAQVAAATWIASRSRLFGPALSLLAIGGAVIVTLGAEHGATGPTVGWQSVVHTALAGTVTMPPPFTLHPIALFLVPSAILLAFVTTLSLAEPLAVSAAIALALISRGALDAPLRALAMCTAAIWTTLASVDGNSVWASFAEKRKREEA